MAVKLSALQSAAKAKVTPYEILDDDGSVIATLQPILLLPKRQRAAIADAIDFQQIILDLIEAGEDAEDDRDMYDLMRAALKLTVKEGDEADFERLEELIGDDPLTWRHIFDDYNTVTMPGEAKSSGD